MHSLAAVAASTVDALLREFTLRVRGDFGVWFIYVFFRVPRRDCVSVVNGSKALGYPEGSDLGLP